MTKKEFVEYIIPRLSSTDKPKNRELWNNSIDTLCKNGLVSNRAKNWSKVPKKYFGEY